YGTCAGDGGGGPPPRGAAPRPPRGGARPPGAAPGRACPPRYGRARPFPRAGAFLFRPPRRDLGVSECAVNTSISARSFGDSAPLRQIRLVCASASAGGSACVLRNLASGNVLSTLRGISEMPIPATAHPSMA